MRNINLLPWREELREKRNKDFQVVLVVVVILSLAVVGLAFTYLQDTASKQNIRNGYMIKEIAGLDIKIREIRDLKKTRSELVERMNLIQALQGNRPVIVRIFDEIVRAVPEDLYFSRLAVKGDTLTIKGVALSNSRLSSLMRNLDDSEWFDNLRLNKVEAKAEGKNEFEILVTLVDPNQVKEAQK